MRRSLKASLVLGAVAAATALVAPAAGAAEAAAAVDDAQDCTTTYVRAIGTMSDDPLVEVTYTPPSTVTVSADPLVGLIVRDVGYTLAYVDCVV